MEATTAVVIIFVAICATIVICGYLAHLNRRREIENDAEKLKVKAGRRTVLDDGTELIHPADLFAIGSDFNITNGLGRVMQKKGLIINKPDRDVLQVRWLEVKPGERFGPIDGKD